MIVVIVVLDRPYPKANRRHQVQWRDITDGWFAKKQKEVLTISIQSFEILLRMPCFCGVQFSNLDYTISRQTTTETIKRWDGDVENCKIWQRVNRFSFLSSNKIDQYGHKKTSWDFLDREIEKPHENFTKSNTRN